MKVVMADTREASGKQNEDSSQSPELEEECENLPSNDPTVKTEMGEKGRTNALKVIQDLELD